MLAVAQACLQQRNLLSAVLGSIAVLFRQTNAVWLVFILGVSVPDVPATAWPAVCLARLNAGQL